MPDMHVLLILGPAALALGMREITIPGVRSNKTNPEALRVLSGRDTWDEVNGCELVAVQKFLGVFSSTKDVDGKSSQCFELTKDLGYNAVMVKNIADRLAPVKKVGDLVCFPLQNQPKLAAQDLLGGDRVTLGWMGVSCGTEERAAGEAAGETEAGAGKTTESVVILLEKELEVSRTTYTLQKVIGVFTGFEDSEACFRIVTSVKYEKEIADENEAQVSPGSHECFEIEVQSPRVWATLMVLKPNSAVRLSWWEEWVTHTGGGMDSSTWSVFERFILVLDDQADATDSLVEQTDVSTEQ